MVYLNRIYKHYKGNLYKVIAIAKHTETLEDLVVYEALYGNNDIWCRPLSMWNEEVIIDEKRIKRFELIMSKSLNY